MQRLGLEAGQGFGLPSETGVQQLDRDRPAQDGVGGPPYLAESACTELFLKHVTTGEVGRGNGHQGPLPAERGSNHRPDLA